MLTQERLKEIFRYDPETGLFTRLITVGQRGLAGAVIAGCPGPGGLTIWVDHKSYRAHRLAWLYMTGAFPPVDTDHRDGDNRNNIFSNLRAATTAENMQNQHRVRSNSLTGIMGVTFHKRDRVWRARITVDGRRRHLGDFSSAEEASAAYIAAKIRFHPFQTLFAAEAA